MKMRNDGKGKKGRDRRVDALLATLAVPRCFYYRRGDMVRQHGMNWCDLVDGMVHTGCDGDLRECER